MLSIIMNSDSQLVPIFLDCLKDLVTKLFEACQGLNNSAMIKRVQDCQSIEGLCQMLIEPLLGAEGGDSLRSQFAQEIVKYVRNMFRDYTLLIMSDGIVGILNIHDQHLEQMKLDPTTPPFTLSIEE